MLFKTTTIMACMLVGDLDISGSDQSAVDAPIQALTVSIPAEWQLKTLVDGAHLKEPKAMSQSAVYLGREIVFKFERTAPDFSDISENPESGAHYHISTFENPNGADYVLTAWRKLADGWLVLRAFAQSPDGEPGFLEAWKIFDSVATA